MNDIESFLADRTSGEKALLIVVAVAFFFLVGMLMGQALTAI